MPCALKTYLPLRQRSRTFERCVKADRNGAKRRRRFSGCASSPSDQGISPPVSAPGGSSVAPAPFCGGSSPARPFQDHRTPYRRIHHALRPALAGHRNIRHPAVSACSRSRRGPGRGSSHSRRDSKLRSGPLSSKPYSFVFSLESFSRMNASISGALARMRSHCSL